MGYYVYPFVVDLEAVRAAVGGNDEKLLAAILKKRKTQIADNAESFADEIAAGAPRIEAALADLVAGRKPKTKHGFQYGYALELVCQHLGKALDAADCAGLETFEEVGKALKSKPLRAVAKALDGGGTPFVPIPKPADFPGIAACEAETCAALAEQLKTLDPDEADLDEDEVDELKAWFKAAKKANKGLAFFFY